MTRLSMCSIWVEPIPVQHRTGHLAEHTWGALLRMDTDPPIAVYVPESDEDRGLTPEQFGAKKAAELGVPLAPTPDGLVWLEPSEGVWVLMGEQRGRRTRGVPTAKRPKPGSAPGFYWPGLDAAGVAS